jgi:hypothetical protein
MMDGTMKAPDMPRDAESFLNCLHRAQAEAAPFRHWLLEDALSPETCAAIRALPLTPPAIEHCDGTREANNASRIFFAGDAMAHHAVCGRVAETFQRADVVGRLAAVTGAALDGTSLRIEYTLDTEGFWLEPHTDIAAKRFTMLIYLSPEPELTNAGTDIFDRDLRHAGAAPFGENKGLIFIPAGDTWHGFIRRPIRGVRRSLIVNYVVPAWRSRHELAFPDEPVRVG